MSDMVINAMSVDVEDYFQVQAFAGLVPRSEWEQIPRRVEANTDRILQQFERARVHATFFTLGWVAERHPGLIRRIVAGGHELASHGYDHVLAHDFSPEAFGQDVGRTKRLLEDIGGVPVRGYRAPTFSIGPRNPWAFERLEQEGYRYSSSVFPIRHDLYGVPDAPRAPYRPGPGALWELPMTTVRIRARNLPCSGGGYFRLLPYRLFRWGLRRLNRTEARPGIFYFHPWEVDPEQPRIPGASARARFRHFVNMRQMSDRIERLLRDFAWDRMDRVFAAQLEA
jgi:polysaccharide deacetylase family protein (PEP-CTERM system associated)